MKNLVFLLLCLFSVQVFGQHEEYNPNSLRPVNKYDQFMKRTIWYRLNLKEKQNRPFFSPNSEITKVIISAVKAGIVRPFENDSLKERMDYDKFLKNLTVYGTDTEEEGGDGYSFLEPEGEAEVNSSTPTEKPSNRIEHFPKDLSILEIREDLIFSKRESRMVHDIQAVTIVMPANLHPAKLEIPLASFSFKELVEQVFRNNPDAIWYNEENPAEHRNLADAFDLRLFKGHIIKFANLDDESLADRYGNDRKGAVNAGLQFEYLMQDFENDLWEY